MRHRSKILGAGLAVLVLTAGTLADDPATAHAPATIEDPRFEFLRQLEGTWVGTGGPQELGEAVFEFRVTAGGHAIEEREMVGTPMEMLTVYHMEGDQLVGTHYCMLGNRPRATAAHAVVDGELAFACSGKPGGAASHADEHVHGWTVRLDPDDRLHHSAEIVKDGGAPHRPAFVLTRQEATARR